jgi:hypothetical protein
MTAAAFQATFADWKLINGRKVVQVVFEVPIEQSGLAYTVLGGMPDPGASVWCAIARLEQPKAEQHKREKKSWDEMTAGQQAGILCSDPLFAKYLNVASTTEAVDYVRRHCGVKSRSDITPTNESGRRWQEIVSLYRAWQRYPDLVDAS